MDASGRDRHNRGMTPLRALELDELRRRTSIKWTHVEPDVLPLWVAEMDAPLAPPVRDALRRLVESSDTGYPGGTEYPEAFAEFARWRWSWDGPAGAAVVADVMNGVVEALRLMTEPGAPVVINPPVYPPFMDAVAVAGRRVVTVPLGDDDRLDLDALAAAFAQLGPGAGYLLCSPHNPTSVVHTADELAAVADLARRHGVRVIVDEIHAPLVPHGFVPYLSVPGTADAMVATSASKAWNLAGVKAGLLLAGAAAAGDLDRLPLLASHGPSHLGVAAHTVALREGREWLDAVVADLAENRALMAELVDRHLPEVRWTPRDGTYLAWWDCRGLGLGDDPAPVLLEGARVAFSSGPSFGEGGAGHVRVNLAATPEVLAAAVDRVAAFAQRAR